MRSTPWVRFTTVIAARGALAAVFGMLFWAVAPMLLGWQSTTVMTGSMEPSLRVGDVVVSMPVDEHQLRKGQVLLFHDPDHAGVLRMHRFDTLNHDGTLTTKGDANPAPDSTPITRAAVTGVGYLRVPLIGTPSVWVSQHDTGALVLLAGALLAVTTLAVLPATRDRTSPLSTQRGARHRARHRVEQRRPGASVAMVVTLTCVIGALALPAPAAAAGFATTAPTSASTLTAATATPVTGMTCTSNSDGSVTVGWNYTGADPDRFTVLVDGRAAATQPARSRAATLSSWNLFTWRSSTVSVRTDLTGTWTATAASTVRIVTVRFLGIGRSSCDV
ncbi:signal peptidase I [Curtobacterium sp. YC1]|uniref:signal peptidase I n=1 Tax=Curtobacterium sp. YC1 TaxID=2795488 RepID=UPI0018E52DE2|nr:signal peptidase I [Curtobacterium sp. YC1]QQD76172.1 signal peptidase I [Curtobacterium sp. YC1]